MTKTKKESTTISRKSEEEAGEMNGGKFHQTVFVVDSSLRNVQRHFIGQLDFVILLENEISFIQSATRGSKISRKRKGGLRRRDSWL